jgi:hypothetical protein
MSGPRNRRAYSPAIDKKPFVRAANTGGFLAVLTEARKQLETWATEANARDALNEGCLLSLQLALSRNHLSEAELIRQKLTQVRATLMLANRWLQETEGQQTAAEFAKTREKAQKQGDILAQYSFELGMHLGELGALMKRLPPGRFKRPPTRVREWALAAIYRLKSKNPQQQRPKASSVWEEIRREITRIRPASVTLKWSGDCRDSWIEWDRLKFGGTGKMTFKQFEKHLPKWRRNAIIAAENSAPKNPAP